MRQLWINKVFFFSSSAIPQMDLIKEDKSAVSDLFINLDIALKFGLVLKKKQSKQDLVSIGAQSAIHAAHQDVRFDHPTRWQSVSQGIQLGGRVVHGRQSHLTVRQYRQYCQ